MKGSTLKRALIFVLVSLAVFSVLESTARGEKVERGIVILVEFPDVKHDIDPGLVRMRFGQHLNNYVKEMSCDRVSLQIDTTKGWLRLPDPVGRYRISSRNLQVDTSRVRRLIDDALELADREVDFSVYSFAAIFMGAKVSDYGMVGLCGYPGMLGWGTKDVLKTRSGQVVKGGIAIFSYQAHLGTLFHDIAHILGGVQDGKRMVPCLYDHDLQAKAGDMRKTFVDATVNMGFWDPMSCHFYERGVPPPGIASWTRMRLNWMEPSRVKVVRPGEKAEIRLDPLGKKEGEIQAVRIPLSSTRYYLIENRQPLGFDRNLPGHGVLIMLADDTVPECRHGKAPVKLIDADPAVPHLKGAAFGRGGKDSFKDTQNNIEIRIKAMVEGTATILINPL